AATLHQFQLLFGIAVGLSVGALYTPLISGTMRWFSRNRSLAVALVSSGLSLGSTVVGPIARGFITAYDWRIAMLVIGNLAWLIIIPLALFVRDPDADTDGEPVAAGADRGPAFTVGEALRTPQFRRDRAHPLRVLRGALRPDLPHGVQRHGPRGQRDGRCHRVQPGRHRLAQRPRHLRPPRRPHR